MIVMEKELGNQREHNFAGLIYICVRYVIEGIKGSNP